MNGIHVENGQKIKCPHCNSIFAIENNKEILYRSITLLYFNKEQKKAQIRCKQCKSMIDFEMQM